MDGEDGTTVKKAKSSAVALWVCCETGGGLLRHIDDATAGTELVLLHFCATQRPENACSAIRVVGERSWMMEPCQELRSALTLGVPRNARRRERCPKGLSHRGPNFSIELRTLERPGSPLKSGWSVR